MTDAMSFTSMPMSSERMSWWLANHSDPAMIVSAEDQKIFENFVKTPEFTRICAKNQGRSMRKKRDEAIGQQIGHDKLPKWKFWFPQSAIRNFEKREQWMMSSPSPEELGHRIDQLSRMSQSEKFQQLDHFLSGRRAPIISLGTWKGHEIRLLPRLHNLEATYLSLKDREDYSIRPEARTPDQRRSVPIVLSLYRNCDKDRVSCGSEASAGSEDFQGSGSSYDDAIEKDYIHDAAFATGPSSVRSGSDIDESDYTSHSFLTASSDHAEWAEWPYHKIRHPNVLRKFIPLGSIEHRLPVEHGSVAQPWQWRQTSWNLVANIDDKRPWLVFTALQVSDSGERIYYGPGTRLASFCGRTVPFSHARLDFNKSEDTSPSISPMFWADAFANGGDSKRKLEIGTIYQDASFALGDVVWDDTEGLHRPGDDMPLTRYEMEGKKLGTYTIKHPPHPEYSEMEGFPFY